MTRVAILDDYQGVALRMADWGTLPAGTEVKAFDDHLADPGAVAARLSDFEVIVAMRERTPFSRALLERLPRLKLLITTGMRNASIDVGAAADRGVVVCGTSGVPYPTAELTWALILGLMRRLPTARPPRGRAGRRGPTRAAKQSLSNRTDYWQPAPKNSAKNDRSDASIVGPPDSLKSLQIL